MMKLMKKLIGSGLAILLSLCLTNCSKDCDASEMVGTVDIIASHINAGDYVRIVQVPNNIEVYYIAPLKAHTTLTLNPDNYKITYYNSKQNTTKAEVFQAKPGETVSFNFY
jgi:hypothetical protein